MQSGAVQTYPLYDELLRRAAINANKSIDIKRLCTTINNIEQTQTQYDTEQHYYEIGALILHHDLKSNNGIRLSMTSYDGRVLKPGKGVIYIITNLPPLLQRIIAEYVENPNIS